jgi:hypothetical protein
MKSSDLFIAGLIAFATAGATAGIYFAAPNRAVLFSVEPPPALGRIAYDSFGPRYTFGSNCWAAGGNAHADWFVPALAGRLSAIELAIEPPAKQAGNATVSLASDNNGFPGAMLESFVVTPRMWSGASNSAPVVVNSVAQPALAAGVKYWLGVRSRGGWIWHDNNQNVSQNAARETRPGRWATAGDYCYVCAFRVLLSTNQAQPAPVN